MTYRLARWLIRLFIGLIADVKVIGLETLNPEQSCIVASNHLGRMDAALVFCYLERQDLLLMVAEKYRSNPIWRYFVKALNLIFVERFNADVAALRACLNHLKQGGVVLMAPEGTRSPTASLQEGRSGASYLASKAGVAIIPTAVYGSEDSAVFANLRRLRRSKIVVRLGQPLHIPPVSGKDREALLEQYTTEIMCQIAAILPPAYRGVYSDHPRLQEILSTQAPTEA